MKKQIDLSKLSPTPENGLFQNEAENRERMGLANLPPKDKENSAWSILRRTLFPFFNLVLYGIGVAFLIFSLVLNAQGRKDLVDAYFGISRYFFLIPLTLNIVISLIQQFRSKAAIDRLKFVNEANYLVLRDSKEILLPSEKIVLGDLIRLKNGEQVPVDGVIKEGQASLDESMLTGESDAISRKEKETVLAGSFLYGGSILVEATGVGNGTYSAKLKKDLKRIQGSQSKLIKSMYTIINIMSVVLAVMVIYVGISLAFKFNRYGEDPAIFSPTISFPSWSAFAYLTVSASSFAIGIIPTGLVLLTSMALSISVVNLSKKSVLIQNLYSLENLSRADLICLDKTGTLTDGKLSFVKEVIYNEKAIPCLKKILGVSSSFNTTSETLLSHYGKTEEAGLIEIPFSSQNKCSGYEEKGVKVLLGAPEYLLKEGKEKEEASQIASQGYRVLALVEGDSPLGLFVLQEQLRSSTKATLSYFADNGVAVKIISGDGAATLSSVASQCGLKGEVVDLSKTDDITEHLDATVYARSTPEQKLSLIENFQKQGHYVAMIGDGVNDILALKKANASITFAKASQAAKSVADCLLLDGDFAHLSEVIDQGRRVINNIERTSILFLMKTVCVFLLSLALLFFKEGHTLYTIENAYLMQASVIAFGGFCFSLERSKEPIRGDYYHNVLPKSLISGSFLFLGALLPCLLFAFGAISKESIAPLISVNTVLGGIFALLGLSLPWSKYRRNAFLAVTIMAIFLAFALPRCFIAGLPLSFSFFKDGSFLQEIFQPWNVASISGLNNTASILTFSLYGFVAAPLLSFLLFWMGKKDIFFKKK